MRDLPTPIRDFILALTDDTLSPAYMLLTEKDGLLEWGGELESYGITGLEKGMDVSGSIPFLTGLLPLGTSSVFLPHVQTKDKVFADVYLFTRDQGTWVLLLDSSVDVMRRQNTQQSLYDSRLQVTELERESEGLYQANAVLEQLVRERTVELSDTILRLQQELAKSRPAKKSG